MQVGEGPNKENFKKEILQAMQVGGAPTQKLTKSQLTIMCKLGCGPQHREFRKEILQAMQVGDDKEIFFLYHTMSHSLSKILK